MSDYYDEEKDHWQERAMLAEDALTKAEQERDDLAARLAEAEAKVARVEALALGWEREFGCGTEAHWVLGQQLVTIDFAVREIRRALDGTR